MSINIWPDILSAGVEKILVFLDAGEVEKSNNDVPGYDLSGNHNDDHYFQGF